MGHESLLVVETRGESIGTIIHYDGDETFLVERGKTFPVDFDFHYESTTAVCEDGALLYTLTECSEEEPAAAEATTHRP
ncbi:MAG TPA: hypothetical protein VHG72_00330 [Polyangia bacterium]|nr:hypothetical protein [Polyangia bacterium]